MAYADLLRSEQLDMSVMTAKSGRAVMARRSREHGAGATRSRGRVAPQPGEQGGAVSAVAQPGAATGGTGGGRLVTEEDGEGTGAGCSMGIHLRRTRFIRRSPHTGIRRPSRPSAACSLFECWGGRILSWIFYGLAGFV